MFDDVSFLALFLWNSIIFLISFLIMKPCTEYVKRITWREYHPVSLFCKEFEWTHGKKSRFAFFKELYDKIRATTRNGFGTYNANIFETKFVITDPNLIEIVSKTRFSHFAFRPRSTYLENDPLTHSIFNLDGKRWAKTRQHLSPAFSAARLEGIFTQIDECAERISRMLSDLLKMTDVIDVNDISRTYVLTVFYCCVFGQEISLQDSNSEFAKMAKLLRNANSSRFKFFDIFSCVVPTLRHIFGGQIFNKTEASNYFKRLIRSTMDRKRVFAENKGRDFLSIFMEFMEQAKNDDDPFKWDMKATEAHLVVFLLGGFTASSSTITFTLYELAKNDLVQEKLWQEIDEVLVKSGGKITADTLRQCHYLDNVVKESLRKYPPFSANLRICSDRFELPERNLVVPKGKTVIVPVCGLHRDSKYYPEPDMFDPERFRQDRQPFSYLPFGEGKRKCIGERFALLVIKMMVLKLSFNFRLSLAENYTFPDFSSQKFTTTVNEMRLRCSLRKKIKD